MNSRRISDQSSVSPSCGFPPEVRIRQRAEFDTTFRKGRRVSQKHLVMIGRPNDQGFARLGLSAGRRVGGAVVRNRVKRRLRELFRRNARLRHECVDLVVHVRPSAATASFVELTVEFNNSARKLARRLQSEAEC